jgi:hypothetical protein
MPLDFDNEQPITLADVPRHVPKRQGKKIHYSTVYRWVSKGARGRVLESALVGGVRFTTVEAVGRFLAANTSTPTSENQPLSAAIEAALKEAGV